jgi:hypothetical protein
MKEVVTYLEIDEFRLQRKIIGLNIEVRKLPGEKGFFRIGTNGEGG